MIPLILHNILLSPTSWLYKLLQNLFHPNLNTQVITYSIVHVYLHKSTISNNSNQID